MKASINSIIYQLRIRRQKTINISPFEAHFGRKANTRLSKISKKPNPSSLAHKRILNHYLDMEKVRWEELISEDNWGTEATSDIEMEQNKDKLSKYAVRWGNADPTKQSRVIPYPDVGRAVPQTESSFTVKIAKETQEQKIKEKPRWSLRDSGTRIISNQNRSLQHQ